MTKTSCIQHPPKKGIVQVKEHYVELCSDAPDPACAAAMLNLFEFWTNVKIAMNEQSEKHNSIRQLNGLDANQDTGLWIWKTNEDLHAELMSIWGKSKVENTRKWLVDVGFLAQRNNPDYGWDRTYQYRLNTTTVQRLIDQPSLSPAYMQSLDLRDQSLKNKGAIPETTTETTKKIPANAEAIVRAKSDNAKTDECEHDYAYVDGDYWLCAKCGERVPEAEVFANCDAANKDDWATCPICHHIMIRRETPAKGAYWKCPDCGLIENDAMAEKRAAPQGTDECEHRFVYIRVDDIYKCARCGLLHDDFLAQGKERAAPPVIGDDDLRLAGVMACPDCGHLIVRRGVIWDCDNCGGNFGFDSAAIEVRVTPVDEPHAAPSHEHRMIIYGDKIICIEDFCDLEIPIPDMARLKLKFVCFECGGEKLTSVWGQPEKRWCGNCREAVPIRIVGDGWEEPKPAPEEQVTIVADAENEGNDNCQHVIKHTVDNHVYCGNCGCEIPECPIYHRVESGVELPAPCLDCGRMVNQVTIVTNAENARCLKCGYIGHSEDEWFIGAMPGCPNCGAYGRDDYEIIPAVNMPREEIIPIGAQEGITIVTNCQHTNAAPVEGKIIQCRDCGTVADIDIWRVDSGYDLSCPNCQARAGDLLINAYHCLDCGAYGSVSDFVTGEATIVTNGGESAECQHADTIGADGNCMKAAPPWEGWNTQDAGIIRTAKLDGYVSENSRIIGYDMRLRHMEKRGVLVAKAVRGKKGKRSYTVADEWEHLYEHADVLALEQAAQETQANAAKRPKKLKGKSGKTSGHFDVSQEAPERRDCYLWLCERYNLAPDVKHTNALKVAGGYCEQGATVDDLQTVYDYCAAQEWDSGVTINSLHIGAENGKPDRLKLAREWKAKQTANAPATNFRVE